MQGLFSNVKLPSFPAASFPLESLEWYIKGNTLSYDVTRHWEMIHNGLLTFIAFFRENNPAGHLKRKVNFMTTPN